MLLPDIGKIAPDFTAPDQDGNKINLKSLRGQNVVLYFYPKAMTPGCTTQACGIRDSKAAFAKANTVVLGISPDASARLRKFADRDALNFTLISDEDLKIANKYGVWGPKKFMGKEYDGIHRMTFIIDANGKLRHIMQKVTTKTHDQDVLAYIRENLL